MRKCWILLLVALLLSGCATSETFETVADELLQPVVGSQREIVLTVPGSAAAEVMESEDGGKLYFCDGYTLAVQTLEAGDLNKTLRSLCGYSREELTVLETKSGSHSRYDWVFTCAGEGGTQVGRGAILDDGSYHYCVTVMAQEALSGSLEGDWNAVFASLSLKA